MKFRYQYRTKDNAICCGEISAANRDAVYAELKAQGIKPSRVEEAPGLLNKLLGKGKRWLAIAILAIAAAVAIFLWLRTEQEVIAATKIDDAVPRHQIYGDPAIVAKFAHYDSLRAALKNDGDALLACFAQPGKSAEYDHRVNFAAMLNSSLTNSQPIAAADSRELKELKQIVNWMRAEMLEYVNYAEDQRPMTKKLESYYIQLLQRVANEKRIYEMIERELKDCTDEQLREEKNAKLRKLGLPSIAASEEK